jgi:hypothetical protein
MSRTIGSEPLGKQQGREEVDGHQQGDHTGRDVSSHQGSLVRAATYRKLPTASSRSRPSIQMSSGIKERLDAWPSTKTQQKTV